MKYLSTFSGIGGFELAIDLESDWECIGYSEIDPYAIQCYETHFNHNNLGSITEIDIEGFPDIDLLVGGSPCQDLSVAKKNRQGLKGERSKLFFKYLEILRIKRPKYFILENVNSMPKESKAMITSLLEELYPKVYCTMIDAALVSAQSRKRLFWTNFPVSQPEDRGIFLKDILEPEVDEKYFITNPKVLERINWKKNSKKLGVIGDKDSQANRIYGTDNKSVTLQGLSGGLGAKTGLYCVSSTQKNSYVLKDKSTPMCAAMGMGGGHVPMIIPDKSYAIDGNYHKGASPSDIDKGKRQVVSGCALRTYPRTPNGKPRSKNCEERKDNKANCLTGVQTDSMVKSNALTEAIGRAGSSSEFISSVNSINDSGYGIRRLTPTECARLQCFPDSWANMLSNTRQYKAYGNAVNVEVVRHLIRCLKEHLEIPCMIEGRFDAKEN